MSSEAKCVWPFFLTTATEEELCPYYKLVCDNIQRTDDISFKLLGLVPIMSGAGVFLLAFKGEGIVGPAATIVLSLAGLFVTIGIGIWEKRNIERCVNLIDLAKRLEGNMKVQQFNAAEQPAVFLGVTMRKRRGEIVIYAALALAWLVPVVRVLEL